MILGIGQKGRVASAAFTFAFVTAVAPPSAPAGIHEVQQTPSHKLEIRHVAPVPVAPAIAGINKTSVFPDYKLSYRHITPVPSIAPPEEVEPGLGGGHKYEVLPRRIWIKPDLAEPALRFKDIQPKAAQEVLAEETKITIEGEPYTVVVGEPPTPKQALKLLPPAILAEKIHKVMGDLHITRKKAKGVLEMVAKKELLAAEKLKEEMMIADEELALIIIMSEV